MVRWLTKKQFKQLFKRSGFLLEKVVGSDTNRSAVELGLVA